MPYTADQHQLIAILCPAALQSPQAQASLAVSQRIVALWEAAEAEIQQDAAAARRRQIVAEAAALQVAEAGPA
jgi:hypothetical protein